MLTISMFYGILIRMFFSPISTTCTELLAMGWSAERADFASRPIAGKRGLWPASFVPERSGQHSDFEMLYFVDKKSTAGLRDDPFSKRHILINFPCRNRRSHATQFEVLIAFQGCYRPTAIRFQAVDLNPSLLATDQDVFMQAGKLAVI